MSLGRKNPGLGKLLSTVVDKTLVAKNSGAEKYWPEMHWRLI